MATAAKYFLRIAFAAGAAAFSAGTSSATFIDNEFVGTSPCGAQIRTALRIPSETACDMILWKLWIYEGRYRLRATYGASVQGQPGPGDAVTIEREGVALTKDGICVLEDGPSFRFIAVDRSCFKTKWRLTLYQDPKTHAPTSYKIEGSLFASGAREGSWNILNTPATVYRLAAAGGQPALSLLKGNDDVLFILGPDLKPIVGNADWSYTLNRRAEPEPN